MLYSQLGTKPIAERWIELRGLLPKYRASTRGLFRVIKDYLPPDFRAQGYDSTRGVLFQAQYTGPVSVVRLTEDGNCWMSNTQLELEAMVNPLDMAKGRVLTSGLGLGFFAFLAARKPEVESITVVEREQDVIDLVWPQIRYAKSPFPLTKLSVVHQSLEEFVTTTRESFDFIFLDIWQSTLGPLRSALKARKLVSSIVAPGGQCILWLQELIDRVLDKLPKEPTTQTSNPGPMEPCLVCSKTLRADYAGLCMDCSDSLRISELYLRRDDGDNQSTDSTWWE